MRDCNEKIAAIVLKESLAPKGGPSGYVFTLYDEKNINKNFDIFVLNERTSTNTASKKNSNLTKKLVFRMLTIKSVYSLQSILRYRAFFRKFVSELVKYKIIHFHKTKDLFFFYKLFPNLCKSKIIVLTSHSPVPMYEEIYATLYSELGSKEIARKVSNYQKEYDITAFKLADILLFPTKGSIESYLPFFIEQNIEYEEKIRFLPTGVKPFKPKIDRNRFRLKLGIPENGIVFAYIGRRNFIKGFDIFKHVAEELSLRYKDVYFIVAGKGMEIRNSRNIVDLGWTNDPDSLANASDFIIVPNRRTYFDLIILQSMSLDKPIITTLTGGNKYFIDKDLNMFFLEKPDKLHLKKIIIDILNKKYPLRTGKNKYFYSINHSPDVFIERYNSFYSSIASGVQK